jgi:hypothetical protein
MPEGLKTENHVKADTKTKLIEEFVVTDASVHDCLRRYFVVTSHGTVAPSDKLNVAFVGAGDEKLSNGFRKEINTQ